MINRQCLIIDNDLSSELILKRYLKFLPFFSVSGVCNSYFEAVSHLSQNKVDLVFLDIELGSYNGFAYSGIDLLRRFPHLPPAIVTTSHTGYAAQCYEIGKTVDYLLKPFDFERFLIAVNRALNLNLTPQHLFDDDYIFLKIGHRFQKFELNDIDYFKASGIYLEVVSNGVSVMVKGNISDIEERLDSKRFVRVHKSYIVNIKKIDRHDHKNLALFNRTIPIGELYKPKLSALLKLFVV